MRNKGFRASLSCLGRVLCGDSPRDLALRGSSAIIGKAWIGGLACSELAESERVERGETVHGAQLSSC